MLSFNLLGRHGRLGNQMFQYAALLAISRRCGTDFCIPRSNGKDQWTDHQLMQTFVLPSLRNVGHQAGVPKIRESSFAYDRNLHLNCPKDADIRGNFQTEKYFLDISDLIRREFEFRPRIAEYADRFLSRVQKPAISLHVRRGDYLVHADGYHLCSVDYYESALARLPSDLPVLILSDDIPWCRSEALFRGKRFVFVEGHPSSIDMCIMSRCSHHVIANSTFSWWGAWLGNNPAKQVIAPSRWFSAVGSNASLDTSDLIPPGWVRL